MFDIRLAQIRVKRLRNSIQKYRYDDPEYKLRDQLGELNSIDTMLRQVDYLLDRMDRLKFNT